MGKDRQEGWGEEPPSPHTQLGRGLCSGPHPKLSGWTDRPSAWTLERNTSHLTIGPQLVRALCGVLGVLFPTCSKESRPSARATQQMRGRAWTLPQSGDLPRLDPSTVPCRRDQRSGQGLFQALWLVAGGTHISRLKAGSCGGQPGGAEHFGLARAEWEEVNSGSLFSALPVLQCGHCGQAHSHGDFCLGPATRIRRALGNVSEAFDAPRQPGPAPPPGGGAPPATHPVLPLLHLVLLAPARLLQERDLGGVLRELRGLHGASRSEFPALATEPICAGTASLASLTPPPSGHCPSPATSPAPPHRPRDSPKQITLQPRQKSL